MGTNSNVTFSLPSASRIIFEGDESCRGSYSLHSWFWLFWPIESEERRTYTTTTTNPSLGHYNPPLLPSHEHLVLLIPTHNTP